MASLFMKLRFKIHFFAILFVVWPPVLYGEWALVNGLPGGKVGAICESNNSVFVAINKVLYRSNNQGVNWIIVPAPYKNAGVLSLFAVDNILFAGTTEGLARSLSKVINWEPGGTVGMSNNPVWSLWGFHGIFFASTGEGVYKSIDNGMTWANMNSGIPDNVSIISFTGILKMVFAASENSGIFMTLGTGWDKMDSGISNIQLSQIGTHKTQLFAVSRSEVYFSKDNGVKWNVYNSSLEGITCLLSANEVLYAGTNKDGIFFSTDDGKTWVKFSSGIAEGTQLLSLSKAGEFIYAGTSAGIFRAQSK